MPIIVKNAGSTPASVEIVEKATGKTDRITLMSAGKGCQLAEGWDVSPSAVLENPRLVVHRVADKIPEPAIPAVKSGSKSASASASN